MSEPVHVPAYDIERGLAKVIKRASKKELMDEDDIAFLKDAKTVMEAVVGGYILADEVTADGTQVPTKLHTSHC
jgi:hypothetical protein